MNAARASADADDFLDAALKYAQRGFKVHPVRRADKEKRPLLPHGVHDATTDPGKIDEYWRVKYPGAGIGLALDGLVAIDIDPRNGGDVDALPGKLPETCTAKTGGGGWHFLYRATDGTRYPGKLAPGVDIKHGPGAYIVVEPSLHASGARYGWVDESEPWNMAPANAPAWLAQAHERRASTGEDEAEAKIKEGGRNNTLTSLAGTMRRRGMTQKEIEAALLIVNAERCDPPLAEAEVRGIAESVSGYKPGAQAAPEAPGDLCAHAFWIKDAQITTNLPYVVKAILGKGQIVVLWGKPGSGKTFVIMEMTCCIGAGKPWHGRRTRKGIVLYVAAESARAYIENRFAALKAERPDIAHAEVFVVPLALDLLHAQKGDVERVVETARALERDVGEVVLIVIDTLATTFGGGNENAPEDMGMYVNNVIYIRQKTGAAVLVVHHCGKDEARGMRGHSALLGALDAELAIEGEPPQDRILRTGKVRDGDGNIDLFAFTLRPVELGLDSDGEMVRTSVLDARDEAGTKQARRKRKGAALGKNQKAVLRALEEHGGRMARIDLANKLKDEGMQRQRVNEAMAALLESRMLIANNDCVPPEVSLA